MKTQKERIEAVLQKIRVSLLLVEEARPEAEALERYHGAEPLIDAAGSLKTAIRNLEHNENLWR